MIEKVLQQVSRRDADQLNNGNNYEDIPDRQENECLEMVRQQVTDFPADTARVVCTPIEENVEPDLP